MLLLLGGDRVTCIAAVVGSDGAIYMGGDSAGVSDDSVLSLGIGTEPKVWKSGGLMFGACGSFRVSQVIRWQVHVPTYDPDTEILAYLTGPLIDSLRDELDMHGTLQAWLDDATEGINGGLLIGAAGRVFEVYNDFGIGELVHGYGATGCGGPIALGNLAATESLDIKPKKRILMALQAAERHSAGVRGPFTIIKG